MIVVVAHLDVERAHRDRAALEAFRGSGPEGEVAGLIRSAAVFEYEV